jgi:putative transposase
VLKQVCAAWQSSEEGLAAYESNPTAFVGRPRLPHYKHTQQGRNTLVYTTQALSAPALRNHMLCPSGLSITVQTR